jgi:Tol biopolymer transport system component
MTRLLLATACFVALALHSVTANDHRARVLMQAAEAKAKVEGDFRAAIKLYQDAEKEAGANRTLVAQALLKMAEAYQELGDPQAQAIYQRIVAGFADQKDVHAAARARVPPMQQASSQARAEGRVEEVVWSGPGVPLSVWPLPDGRSVVHVDMSTGNLALRDLVTGTTRLLTRDAAGENGYERPVVSPSGTRAAVRYGDGDSDSTIRLVSIDGQRNDVLLRDEHDHWLVAWSPDEKFLAAERWPGDGTVTFVLISTADGSIRRLLTLPGGGSLGGFSRDGKHVVYAQSTPENPRGGVYILATDGSASVPLFESPHQFRDPAWSPDGRHVFFTSNRSGAPGLWSVEVAGGKPVGEPVLREPGFNALRFLGFSRDGTIFYAREESQSDVHLVDFDPATLRATNPTRITEFFVGRNSYPVMSPDGRHVAFVRRDGTGPSIVLRTLDSKEERTLVRFQRPYGANVLHWFADGNALLLTDRIERRKRFRKIDIRTGESTTLFEGPWELWTGALSPDGTTLYYSIKDEKGIGNRLVKRNLESGAEEEIYRTPPLAAEGTGLFGLSVSPSGDRVAFTRNVDEGCPGATEPTLCRLLMIVSATGGEPRVLPRAENLFFQGPIGWTPDGRHLVVTRVTANPYASDAPQRLYAVAVDTGEMTPLGIDMPQITSRVVSADGRRIAITQEWSRNEVRALRNVLAASGTAR